MSLWKRLLTFVEPTDPHVDDRFTLSQRGKQPPEEQIRKWQRVADIRSEAVRLQRRLDRLAEAQGAEAIKGAGDLVKDLDANLKMIRHIFYSPPNADLVVREFQLATDPPTRAAIVYLDGLTNGDYIGQAVLEPLMLLGHLDTAGGEASVWGQVTKELLTAHQAQEVTDYQGVTLGITLGDTLLFVDGVALALDIETKGFPLRSTPDTKIESVVRGPQDAFNESFRHNTALVRRRLKDPRLVTELVTVGRISQLIIAVMYLHDVVNPKLVAEVKRRLAAIDVDIILDSGALEEYIEDHPFSVIPQILATERPDRVAAYLSEGHVALVADNSPFALVVPTTLWAQLQSPEDYNLRWPIPTFYRYLRLAALLFSLFVPAFYLSATNYHPEMLPTEMLLFITASRESVPFPAVLELLLMEFSFELIREAGVRVPSVMGSTLGLVGALILGQAAVEAGLVSPVLVVVVALTGLASFAIPNHTLSYSTRVNRFFFIALSAFLGLFGFCLGAALLYLHMAGLQAFGVPYFSMATGQAGQDRAVRSHLFRMRQRPRYTRTINPVRQAGTVRAWDPKDSPPTERGGQRHD